MCKCKRGAETIESIAWESDILASRSLTLPFVPHRPFLSLLSYFRFTSSIPFVTHSFRSNSSVSFVTILLSFQVFHSIRYLFFSFQVFSCRSLLPFYASFCFNSLLVLDSTASSVKHQAGASAREDPGTERSMKRARNCKRISQNVASSAWNSVRKILDPSIKRAGKCKERS